MEKMTDLRALLTHEVQDLYSAEEQIIDAMPAMIEKATNPLLKKALKDHLKVTEQQVKRLDQVQKLLNEDAEEPVNGTGKKGMLGGLFGGSHECKGTKGIIDEGKKTMGEDMNPEVMDAAIIACAQKIEHYEICGYGTAKAFARELNLQNVVTLLNETLDEEYFADDSLTELAVGKLNKEAEVADDAESRNTRNAGRSARGSSSSRSSSGPASRNTKRSEAGKKGGQAKASKSAPKKPASKSAASKSNTASTNKGGSKKAAPKKAASKKSAKTGGRAKAR
jgi:ferritin-like metal-binding protein YciE